MGPWGVGVEYSCRRSEENLTVLLVGTLGPDGDYWNMKKNSNICGSLPGMNEPT